MSRLRGRLSYANVVSTLCLFLLLGGGAYAATQLPKNSVGSKQLKRGAVTAPKIKNGAVTRAKLRPATLSALRGAVGPVGPVGPVGRPGPVGPAGGTLPAGVTLRGVYAEEVSESPGTIKSTRAGTDFGGYTLPTRPIVNLVLPASLGLPTPAACPGTAAAPEAAPGNLCVYVVVLSPASGGTLAVIDPSTSSLNGLSYDTQTKNSAGLGDGRVSRVGFMVTHSVPTSGAIGSSGTWAVSG